LSDSSTIELIWPESGSFHESVIVPDASVDAVSAGLAVAASTIGDTVGTFATVVATIMD
jgi:hypothetical protein